jgi:hypothetical protein
VGGKTSMRLLNKKWTHNYGRGQQELLLADLPSRFNGHPYTLIARYNSKTSYEQQARVQGTSISHVF